MTEAVLDNGALKVRIDLDQGAEITHLLTPKGENVLFLGDWKSPIHASQSQSYGNQALDWLSSYRGGWQELFPNAGGAGTVMGTPMPFHGDVSRARWTAEWHTDGRDVTVSSGTRLPLSIARRMRLDDKRPVLVLEETITNESALTVPYIWGHHPAFGPPLASPGARIDLPAGRLSTDGGMDTSLVDLVPGSTHRWGKVTGRKGEPIDLSTIPSTPRERLLYIEELSAGWCAIRNPANGIGAGMSWDLADFPSLWFWQEIGGLGFPWYGRSAITALEPSTQTPSHGLEAAIAAGTARSLPPGGKHSVRLVFTLFEATDKPVTAIDADGNVHT
ncbi:MAG: DUF4432 family protein [Devosia sp.]